MLWFETPDGIVLPVIEKDLGQLPHGGFLILPLDPPEQHPLHRVIHSLRVGLHVANVHTLIVIVFNENIGDGLPQTGPAAPS